MPTHDDKILLLVVGMHRSGTSALTRALQLLGAELGDDLLPAEAGVNEKGFWEHQQVVALNEQLLQTLDHPWYDPRPLPAGWREDAAIRERLPRAVAILEALGREASLAAIKDPRLCLLLPFWEEAARRAGWSPRVVLASRAPAEVAASLCRRDPLYPDAALLLWFRYTREAETTSRHLPRASIDYFSLLENWRGTLPALARELKMEWPTEPEEAAQALDAAIDSTLRHQAATETGHETPLLALANRIHHRLVERQTDHPALDQLWRELDTQLQEGGPWQRALAYGIRQLFVLDGQRRRLGQEHALALETVAQRDRQLQERTREWKRLGADLEYCRNIVQLRDRQLSEANRNFHDLEEKYRFLADHFNRLETKHRELMNHPVIRLGRALRRFLPRKPE